MSPSLLQIVILAIIQGAAELLPVSSSAHVIVAEKLMHLDPASPEMVFLMIMLHAGTMVAVIAYFWKSWKSAYFQDGVSAFASLYRIAVATGATAVLVGILMVAIQRIVFHGRRDASVEDLTGRLGIVCVSLFLVGVLILAAGLLRRRGEPAPVRGADSLSTPLAAAIGAVQGICLPFRGLSRSGGTISAGMLLGVPRRAAEEFSFALAVVITPPIIAREYWRLYRFRAMGHGDLHVASLAGPGLLGMAFSFVAGLAALRWLSGWLERGRWHYFGVYCLVASVVVGGLALSGF